MFRIAPVQPQDATGDVKRAFDAVEASFGSVPNGVKVLAVSPQALRGYLGFSGALAAGALSKAERELLAILTATRNRCGYCLAAHTLAGRGAGLSERELEASARGEASDPRAATLLRLAAAIIHHRGNVPDEELAAAYGAGLTAAEVVEVVAEVSLSTFTNYLNRLARPELDFPPVAMSSGSTADDIAA